MLVRLQTKNTVQQNKQIITGDYLIFSILDSFFDCAVHSVACKPAIGTLPGSSSADAALMRVVAPSPGLWSARHFPWPVECQSPPSPALVTLSLKGQCRIAESHDRWPSKHVGSLAPRMAVVKALRAHTPT
jgi:hypothetical protein